MTCQNAITRTAAVLGLCGLLVAGCSKNGGEQTSAPNSQIVAHVGDQVITTQEFANELRLLNIPPDKQKDHETVKKVLSEMVTRKYLLQQALTAKLDREPNVLLEILRSREQVLAAAFISRSVSKKFSAISRADIDKYIADNPLRFSGRKLMTVDQISFPFSANTQSMIESIKAASSLDEVDQKLTALGVPHGLSTSTLNSSEIPQELLVRMDAQKPDDVFFVRSGANGLFLKIKSTESRPLEGDAAVNMARQLMQNDLVKAEAGMASVSASLEAKYEGVYSNIMNSKADEGQKN
ncbi:SurA N-terminal domain-containing protein [Nitrobacter sp. Nb-311A]|uniref:SurA N-terminal domain-containing protein n=1 Tax=Nitrobacter sp. Nb-311A TaxID=314253 RepID=UPI000E2F47B3|nr:SurA N-terminal domain-containing protein [Nitrobacter sp. Nb-311A]